MGRKLDQDTLIAKALGNDYEKIPVFAAFTRMCYRLYPICRLLTISTAAAS
jgi:hypothetical protein